MTLEEIDRLQLTTKSRQNFALSLINIIFTRDEKSKATISGANKFRKLDPAKIDWVSKISFLKYPLLSSESSASKEWSKCRNVIDTTLRLANRLINTE